jgi:DNA-binding LacI/PurR family transcriptional regulator
VAARAGVSIGTVSHVISGRQYVAPQTRQRVEDAMAALGYRPNRIARSLILQHTRTLGMVIPDVANPFFGDVMRGVEEVARERGYSVLFGNSDNDGDQEDRYVEEFIERRVDGLLVVVAAHRPSRRRAGEDGATERPSLTTGPTGSGPERDGDTSSLGRLAHVPVGLPLVALDRLPGDWSHDAVIADNEAGLALAVGHLVELGHRRLGFIGGDPALATGRERRAGFEAALEDRGIHPAWVSDGTFSLDSGRAQAESLFSSPPASRPSAIVAANDLLALGVLLAVRERGLSVPDNMSIVGFDDITYARLSDPPLTTVRQPAREMGSAGARLVFRRLDGEGGSPEVVVLRPELVIRSSTARCEVLA